MGSLRTLNNDKFDDFIPQKTALTNEEMSLVDTEINSGTWFGWKEWRPSIYIPLFCSYGLSQKYRVRVKTLEFATGDTAIGVIIDGKS
jgi:hypothetical protein